MAGDEVESKWDRDSYTPPKDDNYNLLVANFQGNKFKIMVLGYQLEYNYR